jgi:hypothetical protein
MADAKAETKTSTEAKKPTAQAPASDAPSPAAQAGGNPAASGDAQVQYLLAVRQTHQMNGDANAVAEVDKQLADLGFKQ